MSKLDILRAMRSRGITKARLCERTGLATQNINSVIDGNPTVKKLQQIADGLECDIKDLFFDENDNNEEQKKQNGSDLFSQNKLSGSSTDAECSQVGFFVFGGKRFKIMECE